MGFLLPPSSSSTHLLGLEGRDSCLEFSSPLESYTYMCWFIYLIGFDVSLSMIEQEFIYDSLNVDFYFSLQTMNLKGKWFWWHTLGFEKLGLLWEFQKWKITIMKIVLKWCYWMFMIILTWWISIWSLWNWAIVTHGSNWDYLSLAENENMNETIENYGVRAQKF